MANHVRNLTTGFIELADAEEAVEAANETGENIVVFENPLSRLAYEYLDAHYELTSLENGSYMAEIH